MSPLECAKCGSSRVRLDAPGELFCLSCFNSSSFPVELDIPLITGRGTGLSKLSGKRPLPDRSNLSLISKRRTT